MHLSRPRLLAIILIGFCIFIFALPVSSQEPDSNGLSMTAVAGYDGFYKGEFWLPVHVTVANNGPSLEAQLRIAVGGNGGDEVIYSQPISLPTQSRKRQTLIVYLPEITGNLTVELVNDREQQVDVVRTNTLQRLDSDVLLYGIVSNEPGVLATLETIHGDRTDASVAYLDIADLPVVSTAWNSLDVVVFHNVDTMILTTSQIEALKAWTDTGGQLVVTGGPSWQKNTGALKELLPVIVGSTVSGVDLPSLSGKAGVPFRDPGPYLVASSTLRSGELLWHQDGLPILARQAYGRGSVYFLALDPDLAPLVDWDGNDQIWTDIAALVPQQPIWATGPRNAVAAANAVSSLPSLALPSTLQLFLFLLVYIAIVGPLNYIVLKKRGRRELAWVTIPIIVIVFTLIAYLTGFRLKGNVTILNQMSVAYGRVGAEQLKVQTLLGLYSPKRATYNMTLPARTMIRPFEQRYGALSGSGRIDAVVQDGTTRVTAIRVDIGDIETFVADSYQEAPSVVGSATLRFEDTGLEVDVSVQNNDEFTLENATVLLGLTGVRMGNLEPGSITNVSEPVSSSLASSSAPKLSRPIRGPIPSGNPLSTNYSLILGTVDFFADQDVFPRWQLLESIAPQFVTASTSSPVNTAYLIAWSGEAQLDADIEESGFESLQTTLYFLELELNQTFDGEGSITIPKPLLNWQVLAESGVFNPNIDDLYLPRGWVEFEYEPWPEFQKMNVSELEVVLAQSPAVAGQSTPRLYLWDWDVEVWALLDDLEWGNTVVNDPQRYIGLNNIIRIRLQNDSAIALEVLEVYPQIEGEIDR